MESFTPSFRGRTILPGSTTAHAFACQQHEQHGWNLPPQPTLGGITNQALLHAAQNHAINSLHHLSPFSVMGRMGAPLPNHQQVTTSFFPVFLPVHVPTAFAALPLPHSSWRRDLRREDIYDCSTGFSIPFVASPPTTENLLDYNVDDGPTTCHYMGRSVPKPTATRSHAPPRPTLSSPKLSTVPVVQSLANNESDDDDDDDESRKKLEEEVRRLQRELQLEGTRERKMWERVQASRDSKSNQPNKSSSGLSFWAAFDKFNFQDSDWIKFLGIPRSTFDKVVKKCEERWASTSILLGTKGRSTGTLRRSGAIRRTDHIDKRLEGEEAVPRHEDLRKRRLDCRTTIAVALRALEGSSSRNDIGKRIGCSQVHVVRDYEAFGVDILRRELLMGTLTAEETIEFAEIIDVLLKANSGRRARRLRQKECRNQDRSNESSEWNEFYNDPNNTDERWRDFMGITKSDFDKLVELCQTEWAENSVDITKRKRPRPIDLQRRKWDCRDTIAVAIQFLRGSSRIATNKMFGLKRWDCHYYSTFGAKIMYHVLVVLRKKRDLEYNSITSLLGEGVATSPMAESKQATTYTNCV